MKFLLDFREKDKSGAVVPGVLTYVGGGSGDPVSDLILAPRITFLIHGYNVNRKKGKETLFGLAELLPDLANDALVAVTWPGDHWLGGLSYVLELSDVRDTVEEFITFFKDNNLGQNQTINFITHSLGANVAMDIIRVLVEEGTIDIGQVCLMAPAIDDDSLSDAEVYREPTENAIRISVLSSVKDNVLKYAYPVGDLLRAWFFSGEDSGLALGYHGPREADTLPIPDNVYHVATPRARDVDHGDYLPYQGINPEQQSAAAFANGAVSGVDEPQFP